MRSLMQHSASLWAVELRTVDELRDCGAERLMQRALIARFLRPRHPLGSLDDCDSVVERRLELRQRLGPLARVHASVVCALDTLERWRCHASRSTFWPSCGRRLSH